MRSTNLLEHVYLCLRKYWRWWVAPMVLGFVLSAFYNKLLATKTYTARQSLILRDDLMGDAYKPSRFESQESLKSAQETVLEIARKPHVIKAVLDQLGPTSSFSFGDYPSPETIENVQGNITLMAPNGAEFGKTEAVVLSVKTVDPERSRKFVNLLLDEIDSKLNEVRILRLESMQKELSQASVNAMGSLKTSSRELQDIEMGFGADITTIRGLNDPQGSGGFDLKLNQIRLEQRQASAQLSSAKNQRELLRNAKESGNAEFATSNELLQMQPALQGLMTNLSTAMAQLAIDEGRYTSLHPVLQRSRRAVKEQKQQLFNSIGTTLKGLDSQIENLEELNGGLNDAVVKLETQLKVLSEQRVPYATLEEEVKKKAEVYNDVQGRLAKVQSYARSTEEVAMLTRVDEPQVSSRADQLGASKAGLLGGAIGLMFGLGLVALIAPPFVDPRTQSPSAGVDPAYEPPGGFHQQHPSYPTSNESDGKQPRTETAAESRLRSVTARQRETPQSPKFSELDPQPSEASSAGNSLMSNALDSVIPDSVAKHMAALKRGMADSVPVSTTAAPETPPLPAAIQNADAPEIIKPSQPPKVEIIETPKAKVSKAEASPPVALPAMAATESSKPSSAASIAKEIEVSKRELANTTAPVKPAAAPVVKTPAKNKSTAKPRKEKPSVSSAEVVAAFKSLQDSKTISASPTHPTSSNATSKETFKESVVPERRPTLSSFANSGSIAPKETPASSNTPKRTTQSSDTSRSDRVRTPDVPESITNGRITAESLLKSTEQKKDSEDKDGNTSKEKVSTLSNEPVAPRVPEGGIEPAKNVADDENSRIPSITDYAKSLDRKIGSVGVERIAVGSDQLSPNDGVGDSSSSQRPSNVRPVDIAKSIDAPIPTREQASGVSASDANADSTQIEKPRAKTISDFVGSIDNSVAGLMREAKNSDVQERPSSASPASVSAAEKVAPQTKKPSATTPTPRDEISSATIPTQIRELSDSFSQLRSPLTIKQDERVGWGPVSASGTLPCRNRPAGNCTIKFIQIAEHAPKYSQVARCRNDYFTNRLMIVALAWP